MRLAVAPTGLDSPRSALFNLDSVTLSALFILAVVGLVAYVVAKPWQAIGRHLPDALEPQIRLP